jgi:hypothetical protein
VPELIRQGLHGRKVILGLWTHNYGSVTRRRKSWSWKEWEERGHGEHRLRVALIPDRSTMDCCIRLTRPDVVLTIPSLEWLKSARAEKSRDAASTIARHLVVSPQVRLRVGLPPI